MSSANDIEVRQRPNDIEQLTLEFRAVPRKFSSYSRHGTEPAILLKF